MEVILLTEEILKRRAEIEKELAHKIAKAERDADRAHTSLLGEAKQAIAQEGTLAVCVRPTYHTTREVYHPWVYRSRKAPDFLNGRRLLEHQAIALGPRRCGPRCGCDWDLAVYRAALTLIGEPPSQH